MASRQAAHACRRAGASAVPASMRLRGLHALQVSSAAHPHRPHGRPTRQRERTCHIAVACHIAVDGWLR